ncbi:MAG: hypothetical protein PHQ36_03705 [Anaerolineales bacterium]|nr:hypothetical protein [Anaerolineales bacterium]
MSYRLMFIVNAIAAAIFGAAFLFVPQTMMRFFGVNDSINVVAALVMARFFGGALMVIAALLWFLKDSVKNLQKTQSAVLMISSVGGFILTIVGMAASKVIRDMGWIPLTIYVVLALGYAYLVFGVSVSVKKEQ